MSDLVQGSLTQSLRPANENARVRISVIIPIYNRLDRLRTVLAALVQQSLAWDAFEVIICNDGSSENLDGVIRESISHSGLRLIHLKQPRQGPGPARNLGLQHARGQIIAFTDSDCIPDVRWLEQVDRVFTDPAVGLIGGQIDCKGAEYLSGRCVNYLMSSMLGSAGARDPRAPIHMRYYPRTCNLAVRSNLAQAVKGFPSASHGEDLEFSHRIQSLGADVRFYPYAIVVHNEKRKVFEIAKEAFLKGRSRVHLSKRLKMHQFLHCLPSLLILYMTLVISLLFQRIPVSHFLFTPGILYLSVLTILSIRGALTIGELKVLGAMPFFAMLLHIGYGLGYLYALIEVVLTPSLISPNRMHETFTGSEIHSR